MLYSKHTYPDTYNQSSNIRLEFIFCYGVPLDYLNAALIPEQKKKRQKIPTHTFSNFPDRLLGAF